jgi:DNA-directed RNA polymerase specialized sigma subunit
VDSRIADRMQLSAALNQLSEQEHRLICLSYESRMTHVDIGLAEGTTTATVSRCIAVGMHKLGKFLEADEKQRPNASPRAIA